MVPTERSCHYDNHVKYQIYNTHCSKVIKKVKVSGRITWQHYRTTELQKHFHPGGMKLYFLDNWIFAILLNTLNVYSYLKTLLAMSYRCNFELYFYSLKHENQNQTYFLTHNRKNITILRLKNKSLRVFLVSQSRLTTFLNHTT